MSEVSLTQRSFLRENMRMRNREDSREYDSMFLPSIFDTSLIFEFEVLMSEMYYANLFMKEHGVSGHRGKAIVAKMFEEEKGFMERMDKPESKGIIDDLQDFCAGKDKAHTFDSRFVRLATEYNFNTHYTKASFDSAVSRALMETIDSSMMLTSSLRSSQFMRDMKAGEVPLEKVFSYETLRDLVSEVSNNTLLSIIGKETEVVALFSLFSKAQIGGAREILIMFYRLRVIVKFVETVFKHLCESQPKDMLTKDYAKSSIQSDTLTEFREEAEKVDAAKKTSFIFSINADAKRWSPSIVMEQFIVMADSLPFEKEVKEILFSTFKAFSYKALYAPDSLIKKWKSKPLGEMENDPLMEEYRKKCMEEMWHPIIRSGMGQGMLHYTSCFYHCVIDDYSDYYIKALLMSEIKMVTMISSDDKTKMCRFIVPKAWLSDPKEFWKLRNIVLIFLSFFDFLQRLGNCHINWKKTTVNTLITEFNSMFSLSKRVVLAVIKDAYNIVDIPDMTYPEEAVKAVISSFRRAFSNGAYLDTLEVVGKVMRENLIRYYDMSSSIQPLCKLLNCTAGNLPFHYGFLSTSYLLEQMIYGVDFLMFMNAEDSMLRMFYRSIYSGKVKNPEIEVRDSESAGRVFMESVKVRIRCPIKLEKKAKKVGDRCKTTFSKDYMDLRELHSLEKLPQSDPVRHYIFSESFRNSQSIRFDVEQSATVHTLIRALSFQKKFIAENLEEEEVKITDLVELTHSMLNKKGRSLLDLFTQLKDVVSAAKEVEDELKKMSPTVGVARHTKIRWFRFHTMSTWNHIDTNLLSHVMLGLTRRVPSKLVEASQRVKEAMGIGRDEVLNPAKLVTLFNTKSHLFTRLIDFLEFNKSVLSSTAIRVNHAQPSCGNFKGNLTSLYAYKSSSSYVLRDDLMRSSEMRIKPFLSTFLCLFSAESDIKSSDEILNVTGKEAYVNNRMSGEEIASVVLKRVLTQGKFEIDHRDSFPMTFLRSRDGMYRSWLIGRDMAMLRGDVITYYNYSFRAGENMAVSEARAEAARDGISIKRVVAATMRTPLNLTFDIKKLKTTWLFQIKFSPARRVYLTKVLMAGQYHFDPIILRMSMFEEVRASQKALVEEKASIGSCLRMYRSMKIDPNWPSVSSFGDDGMSEAGSSDADVDDMALLMMDTSLLSGDILANLEFDVAGAALDLEEVEEDPGVFEKLLEDFQPGDFENLLSMAADNDPVPVNRRVSRRDYLRMLTSTFLSANLTIVNIKYLKELLKKKGGQMLLVSFLAKILSNQAKEVIPTNFLFSLFKGICCRACVPFQIDEKSCRLEELPKVGAWHESMMNAVLNLTSAMDDFLLSLD